MLPVHLLCVFHLTLTICIYCSIASTDKRGTFKARNFSSSYIFEGM